MEFSEIDYSNYVFLEYWQYFWGGLLFIIALVIIVYIINRLDGSNGETDEDFEQDRHQSPLDKLRGRK